MDFRNYSIQDFINDENFIEWVVNPTLESDKFWRNFLKGYPEKKDEFNKSRIIIKSFIPQEKDLTFGEKEELWDKIKELTISKKTARRRLNYYMVAAASVLVAVISSFFFFPLKRTVNHEINYAHLKAIVPASNECKLILADNSQIVIPQTESSLRYSVNGKLKINSRQIDLKTIKGSRQSDFNQLIVPWGKRSSILFSDGTRLWLNSGSRAIYPVEFSPRKREVYVEGEAYLEVSHNALRPFTVKTAAMDVRVLGTRFNVSAYPEDKMVSVVLVEGSVKAKVLDSQIKLSPNQMITYNEKTNRANLQKVDVLQYISWKDGWLLCDCEKLEQVFEKLSRYYNCKIRFTDEKAKSFQLSGKLDLKNNIEQVMQVIASTVPIKVDVKNHTINVSSKKKGVLMKKT